MTKSIDEIETEAKRIVDTWRDQADPVAALEALRKTAPRGMGAFFAMLASELAMVMNEEPGPDDPA